jgi:hypothetical protein
MIYDPQDNFLTLVNNEKVSKPWGGAAPGGGGGGGGGPTLARHG